MNTVLKRAAALSTMGAVALGAALLAAPAANAAATGSLSFTPSSGNDTTSFSVTTSAACSGGSYVQEYISGGNFTALTGVSPNTPQAQFSTDPVSGGLVLNNIADNLAGLAQANGVQLAVGTYTFDAICKNAVGPAVFDDFQGKINVTQVTPTVVWSAAVVGHATTTTVTPSPASPADAGTPVTFTASVTVDNGTTATGSVQFLDNGANSGAPVTLANGKAAYTTSTLAKGTHQITARYTPDAASSADQPSVSAAVAYTVNGVKVSTTTALAVSPSGTAVQNTPVALTATVLPNTATGSVQFTDNGLPVGAPVAVTAGTATLTNSTFAVGAHSFAAKFTSSDQSSYGDSTTQTPLAYQVTAPVSQATGTETISTTVTAGSLTISVPDSQVTLPSPVLNNNGDLFTTSGALKPVTITDNRAGNPGWTLSGQVSDFSDGATHGINGENLGWSPNVVDHSTAQTLTLGAVVNPANGVPLTDVNANGLKGSQVLATAASGAGLGTAHLAAGLALNVPTTTVAGTYVATLTLTAI
ncbi:Ig-like domain-containing protein [Catenulispora yoronensis]|uniref:Ig-like domain-containing protein n=1 Tax=Catenulispora yoronensis TaxID=450799 RepID=A0ABN2ULM1_9ACTN